MSYDAFIASKLAKPESSGFEPQLPIEERLFPFQRRIVEWSIRQGRAALFEECGLGKTIQQLEWARHVRFQTQSPVLILCPLAVASQTVEEGKRFGIRVTHVRNPEEVVNGINITNYERLDLFDPSVFSGVVLDESSILKNFTGKTRIALTEAFSKTPYRLACTATPAPNDYMEFGQHAEFLGICSSAQMLATWFINDTMNTGEWRLKKHAAADFWKWVGSWAACVSTPSDIGFDDDKYKLPPLNMIESVVEVIEAAADGVNLFKEVKLSATTMHAELRETCSERVARVAELVNASDEAWIVWCNTNQESDELLGAIKDAIEVRGSDKPEHKERKIKRFLEWGGGGSLSIQSDGKSDMPQAKRSATSENPKEEALRKTRNTCENITPKTEQNTRQGRVLISKPSICGYGLNFQHCRNVIFVGLTYSFEDFYQALRRSYRFGQTKEVNAYIVRASTEDAFIQTVRRKMEQHKAMQERMKFASAAFKENFNPSLTMKSDITTFEGEGWTVHNGDCVRVAKTLDPDSIGFSIFSPPFADLFTYSADAQDMGNCSSPADFMTQFEFLIDELMRVTMPGRECAVHCCDLLSTKWKHGKIEFQDFSGMIVTAFRNRGWLFHSRITIWKSPVTEMQRTKAHGLLYKTLRTDSSDSRVGAPDYLLCFRKPGDNPKPITHTPEDFNLDRWQEIASPVWMTIDQGNVLNGALAREQSDERHICPLQLDVIERALMLWSAPDDLVFSPFTGIGSEGYQSVKMGRRFVGAELKESYVKQACKNLKNANLQLDLFAA